MKHVIRIFFLPLILSVLGTSMVMAADSPKSGPPKIGVLDWQQLLTKAPQAEAAGKRLEEKYKDRKEKLLSKQKEFQSKQDKMQRDRDVMSMTDRTRAEKELNKLQQNLRLIDEELRSDYTSSHRDEMDDFVKIVKEALEKLADKEKYDVVLPQEATLYMAGRVDITEEVLKELSLLAKTKTGRPAAEKEKSKNTEDKK